MAAVIVPTDEHERELRALGYKNVAGIDEAGRGALAGPVVAGAVLLPEGFDLPGVRDSKLIPEPEREELFERITDAAVAWGVGIIDNCRIDRVNILQATFLAMAQAVASLSVRPDIALIDGRDAPDVGVPCRAMVKGDALCRSIAAASIVAKVTRDRIMREEDRRHPLYGLARNKGYGTALHRAAIIEYGPSSIHRLSFLGTILQQRIAL